ncbi:Serine carboxypeptidase-like 45 [Morus notabilis]|uniref:Carboxypeptidase n=1 Tax=Morus notabilis TaxID=981085 RepID=W9R9G3_9ROSA|nr:Serine carboxypeptidase-like 45 [Morus notabilis]
MRSQPWTIFARTLIEILITWNSISEAAKIISLPGQPQVSFQQYSGYITVDESTKRSLFYYFVEAETDPASKPLVLWLNGGANMLYLESPAGVGFSYSANQSFYTEVNDGKTAHDNLEFLRRWFLEFPEYKSRDFFITGESYAGHYVPQLAQLIVESKVNFSLKGIAIGNPLLEFNTDFNSRAEFFWSHGLISDSSYESATLVCNYSTYRRQIQIIGSVSPACYGVWRQAFKEVSKFVDLYDVTLDVCLSSVSTQSLMLNHLQETAKIDVCVEDQTTKYLNRKDVQKAFHAELHGVTEWTVCSK